MYMERLRILFKAYLDNSLSEAEYAEFCQLLGQEDRMQMLSQELQELWDTHPEYRLPVHEWDKKFKALKEERLPKAKRTFIWRYVAAAAVVLLVAGSTYLFLYEKPAIKALRQTPILRNDIAAGTNGAILSFANGKTIVLDTARNGQLMEGVVKNGSDIAVKATAVEYATLTTPRAKQQQLILDDGTKVWLNAASSIRFPSAFTGPKRVVEITGEAYFEVAKNPAQPFVVKTGESEVEVLGTHFNVMAYANEHSIQTTLLEGSVTFSQGNQTVVLKPGQQSRLSKDGQIKVVEDADVELATAWKNGQQLFRQADIATIMRQVERWYNVDVQYQTALPANTTFSGDLPRNVNLSELLKVFEREHLHFSIDVHTRKVTVTE